MIRPLTILTIQQQPTDRYPNRNESYQVYYINTGEIQTSVDEFTDYATIIFPRRLYLWKGFEKVDWVNKNASKGDNPIILAGDKIKIEWRTYYYQFTSPADTNAEKLIQNTVFEGWVNTVDNGTPVVIRAQNNMWKLKQIPVANKVWTDKDYTLETMLQEMLEGTGFAVNTDNVASNIGEVTTENVTVADVLERLSEDYKYKFYFVGDELRCGVFRYWPQDRERHKFNFNRNIIDYTLEWKNSEDIPIKLVAYSVDKFEDSSLTQSGRGTNKRRRLQVEVGESFGSTRTAYFPGVSSEAELRTKAEALYGRINFDGFKGSFTTFCIPLVRKGNVVELIDSIQPERSGNYLVKGVTYTFGVDGYRQDIEIDYLVSTPELNEFA